MKAGENREVEMSARKRGQHKQQGFTLIETSIALVVMMVVGLGAASLFVYALRNNSSASNRGLSMGVAQRQMEQLRKAAFADLDARVTAMGGGDKVVTSSGRRYRVVTTITNTVAGDATRKTIMVRVAPLGTDDSALSASQQVYGGVTIITQRATSALGPNLGM